MAGVTFLALGGPILVGLLFVFGTANVMRRRPLLAAAVALVTIATTSWVVVSFQNAMLTWDR
jgi:hypothetical protein